MEPSVFDSWEHSWDLSATSAEIGLFEEYLVAMEKFLEDETQKHSESLKNLIAKGEIYYDGETGLESNYDSHRLDLLSAFKDRLRRSFFVSVFSFLESELLSECHYRKTQDKDILLNFNDLAGQSSIDKAVTYLTKVLRLDHPRKFPEWIEIQNYKILRNCIVHAQGRVDQMKLESDQRTLKGYIAQKKNLSFTWGEEVSLDKGFCEEALTTIEAFLHLWLYT